MRCALQGKAVRELLAHRLSPRSSDEARSEWYEIVEGEHTLWDGVSDPYKHTIRAFLVHFHTQILRSSQRFNFRNGSVGGHAYLPWHCVTCNPFVNALHAVDLQCQSFGRSVLTTLKRLLQSCCHVSLKIIMRYA